MERCPLPPLHMALLTVAYCDSDPETETIMNTSDNIVQTRHTGNDAITQH